MRGPSLKRARGRRTWLRRSGSRPPAAQASLQPAEATAKRPLRQSFSTGLAQRSCKSSRRPGPNRCPARGTRTPAGRGDRSAACAPRIRTGWRVAMRGELPLPEGATPWTPYVALTPSRGVATGNADGSPPRAKPSCQARMGAAVPSTRSTRPRPDRQSWTVAAPRQAVRPAAMRARPASDQRSARRDKEKHVWIIDDQLCT